MLQLFLICVNFCTVLTTFNDINPIRSQSSYPDGMQLSFHDNEPRWIVSPNAHRKTEACVILV